MGQVTEDSFKSLPPLSSSESQIRLLKFSEHSWSDLDDICCNASVHDLDEQGLLYVAISYTWGPEQPTTLVHINEEPVHIRNNCYHALRQVKEHLLRHRDRCVSSTRSPCVEPELFWIDSICIDQWSIEEKNIQVAQMGRIYSTARKVALCVGLRGEDEDLFACTNAANEMTVEKTRCPSATERATVGWDFLFIQSRSAYDQISFFAQRPYFQRLWTVQECIVAQDIVVLCENDVASWSDLVHLAGSVDRQWEKRDYYAPNARVPCDRLVQLQKDRERYQLSSGDLPKVRLGDVVLDYKDRQCSNLRDKVFGLLSLVPAQQRTKPAYDKPLLDVLTDFAGIYPELESSARRSEQVGRILIQDSFTSMLLSIDMLSNAYAESMEFMQDLSVVLTSRPPTRSLFSRSSTSRISRCPLITPLVTIQLHGECYTIQHAAGDKLLDLKYTLGYPHLPDSYHDQQDTLRLHSQDRK